MAEKIKYITFGDLEEAKEKRSVSDLKVDHDQKDQPATIAPNFIETRLL